jgi:hypothetical protein
MIGTRSASTHGGHAFPAPATGRRERVDLNGQHDKSASGASPCIVVCERPIRSAGIALSAGPPRRPMRAMLRYLPPSERRGHDRCLCHQTV